MKTKSTTIANGTAVICKTGGSHFKFGLVADTTSNEWGTHHEIMVTLISNEPGRNGEFETAHVISDENMKGIGWKLATVEDIRIANLYSLPLVGRVDI